MKIQMKNEIVRIKEVKTYVLCINTDDGINTNK